VKHLLVIALAAATLTAADATGTWTGTLTPSDGQPGPAHVVLKQEGDKLTGTAGPDASEQHPIQNGRAENGTLTFELQTGDTLMKVTLAQKGDEMTGSAARAREDRTQTATIALKRAK
jgi:hypothetical protein